MENKIDKFLNNPIALTITGWAIFIIGSIVYIIGLIPQEWTYIYGLIIGSSTIFFDLFLSTFAQMYQEEIAKIYAEYDAKHQARLEEFEKLKKEYGIDDEE